MSWTYSQATGAVTGPDGNLLTTAYSGNGQWLNDPASQDVKDHGPLPQGRYIIGKAATYPRLGPMAMPLTPDPANEMFGRGSFFIHGDTAARDHTASDGCIVVEPESARETIDADEDRELVVTA